MNQLANKNVVVFGGTSGIGLAAAVQARALGAQVYVVGSNAERAEAAAAEHGLAGWRSADVTQAEAVAAAMADLPIVHHLVLLAGSFVARPTLTAELSYLQRAFDERIWAAIHTLRALGDRLAADASVTFISGQLADRPTAGGTAVLAAASAAMEALARGLALELAPRRFNTVAPGATDTPMLGRVLGAQRDAAVSAMSQAALLKRLGTAEEAAAAVVFLMTNQFMNGETLHVDGGGRLQ